MTGLRRLIVNADDFGFTRDVNEGIIEAHRNGILTSAAILANGGEFAQAVLLAMDNPKLDVGVHLALVGGRALSRVGKALPDSPWKLVAALAAGGLDMAAELDAQMKRVFDAGLRPTHVDTHKHTHLDPRVAEAVAGAASRYGVGWVRRPLAAPLLGAWAAGRILGHGLRMTDHFAGYRMTGRFGVDQLAALIRRLPEGTTEFMCHPGYCRDELRAARTRLKESRQRELEALTSEQVKRAVVEAGVELSGYGALPAHGAGSPKPG